MKSAVTIGNFDGVHRGHAALIEAVSAWRSQQCSPEQFRTVALTFEPHPREVLGPDPVERLCSREEKLRRLRQMGIDEVRILSFTAEFARIPPREFLEHHLVAGLGAKFIAVGHNFFFGHGREGTPELLLSWAQERNIEAQIVAGVESDGSVISSSRIRALIKAGHMPAASRLLGRDYALVGVVSRGDQKGSSLGFPTANIYPSVGKVGDQCLPATGVYLTTATLIDEGRSFPAVTNIGHKPTLGTHHPLCMETHLLDFEGNLYGKRMSVEFKDRLRGEQKFPSIDHLRKQIQEDILTARQRIT